MWRRSGIKLRRRGAYRRHDALPLEGLERLSPGCGKPLAVVTVSRSARRGLHASDGGTSSHFLPIVPRKARQCQGLRVQEKCTQACSQLADRIGRVSTL